MLPIDSMADVLNIQSSAEILIGSFDPLSEHTQHRKNLKDFMIVTIQDEGQESVDG